ncbi:MAG: hypothetical protein ACMUJM_05840 [bacterium]
MKREKFLIYSIIIPLVIGLSASHAIGARKKKASDKIKCIICHTQLGKDLAKKVEQWQSSVHGQNNVTCPACHGGDPTSFNKPKTEESGYVGAPNRNELPEFCAKCHSSASWMRQYNKRTDQLSLYRTSAHGKRLFEKNDEAVAVCTDCHGQHDIYPVADKASSANHMKIAETCAGCHSNNEIMEPRGLKSNQLQLYKKSYHGEILYGKIANKNPGLVPSCPECHGIHGATPAGVNEISHVCGNCHANNAEQFARGDHQEALDKKGAPRCIDCHDYHEILFPTLALFDGAEKHHCGYCHPLKGHEYNIGQEIKNSIVKAQGKIDRVTALVGDIEYDPGLDVKDERDNLAEAQDYLLEVAPVTHTIDLKYIKNYTNKSYELAVKTETVINKRISEFIVRKKWLFATLMIIFMIIGYILFNRWTIHIQEETGESALSR